jgi:hypothetical protein
MIQKLHFSVQPDICAENMTRIAHRMAQLLSLDTEMFISVHMFQKCYSEFLSESYMYWKIDGCVSVDPVLSI